MTIKLKPCPFCGGEAVVDTITTAMEKEPRFRARCVKCWCKTDWDLWSEDEAVDAWNRRANDAEQCLISREAAIRAVHEEFDECLVWDESGETTANAVENVLHLVQSVDAVPVVRCADCIHYNNNYCGDGFGWCERKGIGHETSDDWFCADGERVDAPTCGPDFCEIGGGDDADGETPLSR